MLEALGRRNEQPCAIRRGEDQRLRSGLACNVAWRVSEIEAGNRLEPSLAGELRRPLRPCERMRFLDLGATEHAAIPRRDCLRHRGGCAQHVDDDSDRCRCLLTRSEGDVHEHVARLVRMSTADTGLPTCYRHPDRETGLSCSECGRPICTECMTPAAVGLRCPDHAGTTQAGRPAARRPPHSRGRTDALVTRTLIAVNVVVYLITVVQGAGVNARAAGCSTQCALYGRLRSPTATGGACHCRRSCTRASCTSASTCSRSGGSSAAPVEQYLGRRALPRSLLRLRPRGLRRCALFDSDGADRRCLGCDLRDPRGDARSSNGRRRESLGGERDDAGS